LEGEVEEGREGGEGGVVGEGVPQVWRVVDPRAPIVEQDVRREGGREGKMEGESSKKGEEANTNLFTLSLFFSSPFSADV